MDADHPAAGVNFACRNTLKAQIARVSAEQHAVIQQISQRADEGRPRLPALDDTLDKLEHQRSQLNAQIKSVSDVHRDRKARLDEFQERHSAQGVMMLLQMFFFAAIDGHELAKSHVQWLVRTLVQCVIVGKTSSREPASLQVHGRIATLLAAMDAEAVMMLQFGVRTGFEAQRLAKDGKFDDEAKRKEFLDRYVEELLAKQLEWSDIQVSVVAGAGFEPAAFRL